MDGQVGGGAKGGGEKGSGGGGGGATGVVGGGGAAKGGGGSRETMVAPGRGGSVHIPRESFERDPQGYFAGLREISKEKN
ncbi:hypothetical protein ACJRO7_012150 [Eucalyptus globulus]|uniref:Uncharacterized protein n=1 Tax=Eucalyptus globulus TaxID=34317 RepID=A0ABD3LKZ7_EUCGL